MFPNPSKQEQFNSIHFYTLTHYFFCWLFIAICCEIEKSKSGMIPGRRKIHLLVIIDFIKEKIEIL